MPHREVEQGSGTDGRWSGYSLRMNMTGNVIDIQNLRFAYGGTPFRLEISRFHLDDRERIALIGPSGCGKSTLLDLIAGIRKPTSGSVETVGTRLDGLASGDCRHLRLDSIGFVFQEFRLLEYLTIRDSILLPLRLAGRPVDSAVQDRIQALAARAGIQHLLKRRPARLSQGERQRAAICRALLSGPSLVLADEPTGNLDPVTGGAVSTFSSRKSRKQAPRCSWSPTSTRSSPASTGW
jgi:putative ABC transport system ATP-binding protein